MKVEVECNILSIDGKDVVFLQRMRGVDADYMKAVVNGIVAAMNEKFGVKDLDIRTREQQEADFIEELKDMVFNGRARLDTLHREIEAKELLCRMKLGEIQHAKRLLLQLGFEGMI
jgi:hypothetical protein